MKYTIEIYCCDSCHVRSTNNDVMNSILGYKDFNGWITDYRDGSHNVIKVKHFCSQDCFDKDNDAEVLS